ncbi:TolB-like translocation protein [Chitinophaga lutea]|uniref:hypothetical protein n=1 Tax=Chitinophaga lutea TaxID=2488634 RepID=UPI000F4D47F1|nr:hypothetical protein [Chitinophaga lutea]
MRRILGLVLAAGFAQQAGAQQFGGNPPSLRWQQINTDTVRVIFPRGMEAYGRRVADITGYVSRYHRATIGPLQRKVNIVLQNQTLQSNGYVQLGPFRSEFFMTPPPSSNDVGSLNWADQLALHEYRHVLQNSNFRKGISKVVFYLSGELGQAAATNIAVPNWFWEGDAVVTETALSNQGRGRLPAFFNGFRALQLAGRPYTYMQLRNGSYRRYMPDHYATGYLMTSYGRLQYGPQFWNGVTDDAVRYRRVFYPFSQSLKHRTGKNAAGFFRAALGSYAQHWPAATEQAADTLTPVGKHYTDYKYVYAAGNGRLIVSKSSFKAIPAFYEIGPDGKESRITAPGLGFDDYFSYRNGQLLWTESRYSPRWGWKDYSIVKIHDRASGQTRSLRHERRCFSPDLSADGRKVAVVAVTPEQAYRVEILDAQSGAVLQSLPNPENWYYTYPKFAAGDRLMISAVRDKAGRMGLISQSVETGESKVLVPFGVPTIGIASVEGNAVYFTAAFGDADNVYRVTLDDNTLQQVTRRPNGVQHMAVTDGGIIYSEFTASGHKLLKSPLQPVASQPRHSAWLRPDFGEGGDILDKVPARDYEVRKYPKAHRLFNFHSWLPRIDDPDYGLYLYGENVLGTLQTAVGASYNINENSPEVGASVLYGAWFPYLRAGVDYRMQRKLRVNDTISLEWNELDWYAGFSVPLNFTAGKYFRSVSLGANFHHLTRARTASSKYRFRDDNIQYVDAAFTFSNQRIRAVQNIYSHFAQSLVLRYNKTVNNVPGEQFTGRLDLYLPGFSANHSLVLQGAYQQRDTMLRYAFTDHFVYARGYEKPFYEHIYKAGANYHFPICYPDWGFANLLYFMRLRGNVFYDHSVAYNFRSRKDVTYASAGGELFFDTKLGNVLPFSFGVRYSRLFDTDPVDPARSNRFEVIVPLQQLFAY